MLKTFFIRRLTRNGGSTWMSVGKEMLEQLGWMTGDQVLVIVRPPYAVLRKLKPEDVADVYAQTEIALKDIT